MIELPKQKSEKSRRDPKTIVLFGHPKSGKTTILAELEDCLILDLEQGSEFVSALKIDIVGEATKANLPPIAMLHKLIQQIKAANEKNGGYVYKRIAIDTVTALESMILPMAAKMYKETPMGRNWQGDDVTTLPNGAGYGYTRKAMLIVLDLLKEICDTLFIIGHVKDKLVEREGKEMGERALDLVGKLPAIVCSKVDAVGYLYRDENKTKINFASSESLLVGSRCEHLTGADITIAESDADNNIKVDWSQVFIEG